MSVLITGGTRGLGLELAKKFSKKLKSPKQLHLLGRDENKLKLIGDQLGCKWIMHDLSKTDKIQNVINYVESHMIKTLVVNAAVYFNNEVELTDVIKMININLMSNTILIKKFYENRKKFKSGYIISINSVAGIHPNAEEAYYCATKFGLTGFIQSLQERCSFDGIRISEYFLGAMKTDMTKKRKDHDLLIDPKEVADLIVNNLDCYKSLYIVSQKIKRTVY